MPVTTQILVGKPFQVVLQWAEEIKPSLVIVARHGAHRIEGTDLGSQAENLIRLKVSVAAKALFAVKEHWLALLDEEKKTVGREIAYIVTACKAFT